ncbi:MAG TPA: MmgE/PrpD family protein [Gaiellaceae bacterium]|nr:MmgE/PrpD family protein [Gaiellaceae bacterium]
MDSATTTTGTVARRLAQYTYDLSTDEIPDATIRRAQLNLLDTLGCAIGALGCDAGRIMEKTIDDLGGSPESTVIGSGRKTSVLNALLVNGILVRFLDCNDGYLRVTPDGGHAGGHPSDGISMVLALAEREGTSGRDTLASIILLYQLFGRIAHCERVPIQRYGWCVEAKAPLFTPLVAGKMLGLDVDQLEQAVGISGTHGFVLGILDVDGEEYGMTKNLRFPRTSHQGVIAAYQARNGFTGTRRVIEGNDGFKQTLMGGDDFDLDELELEADNVGYIIDQTLIKNFSAEGSNLGHLSATYELLMKHDIQPEDIEKVHVKVVRRCATHCGGPEKRRPETAELADHSIYYTTAALILFRAVGPAQYEHECLHDPRLIALMDKVTMEADEELDRLGQAGISEITLKSGETLRSFVEYPRGHAQNPMTEEEITRKFMGLATPNAGEQRAREVVDAVMRLHEAENIDELMKLMTLDGAA